MESDPYGRRHNWNMTQMEYDPNGKHPKWKTNQNGKRPKWKKAQMEDKPNGRRFQRQRQCLKQKMQPRVWPSSAPACLQTFSTNNTKEWWLFKQNN